MDTIAVADRSVGTKNGACMTDEITRELSRCRFNDQNCHYGLPAGATSTYCLHPDHLKFRQTENVPT